MKYLLPIIVYVIMIPYTLSSLPMPNGDNLAVRDVKTDDAGHIVSAWMTEEQEVTTPVGKAKLWCNLQFYPSGALESCEFDYGNPVKLKVPAGEIMLDDVTVFYENGNVEEATLNAMRQHEIKTPLGAVDAYLVGFYEDATIKDVAFVPEEQTFPVETAYGKLDAASPISFHKDGSVEGFKLNIMTTLHIDDGFDVPVTSIKLYSASKNASEVTIDRATVMLDGRICEIKDSIELYEGGNIKSIDLAKYVTWTSSLGDLIIEGRTTFFEKGTLHKTKLSGKMKRLTEMTKSDDPRYAVLGKQTQYFSKAPVYDEIEFYEDGKVAMANYGYGGVKFEPWPFHADYIEFWPDGKPNTVRNKEFGKKIMWEGYKSKSGDYLRFDETGKCLGRFKRDKNTGEYIELPPSCDMD